ncbi:MAG: DUF3108 domain-containing protein [Candidatus Omnitrophica bacterium]|nr:DUF3108 domain-containing protein [Candidatus Omnitrophota bacterium]
MNRRNLIVIVFLVCSLSINGCSYFKTRERIHGCATPESEAEMAKTIAAPMGKLVPGEKLTYNVSWLGMRVGDATLEVKKDKTQNNGKTCRVVLKASTTGFFSFFYNVKGSIESIVDADTFKPIQYNSQTHINKKFIFKEMDYDFTKLKVNAVDKKGKYEVDITADTLDPLGVFYYFRKNDVVLNKCVDIMVNGGKKNFPVRIYARREHFIKTPAGRFLAFQVEPTRDSERQFDDCLNAEGSMRIWFSADMRRVPLIILLKVPVGTAQATLIKMELPES